MFHGFVLPPAEQKRNVPMTVHGGVITDLAFVSMLTLERDHGDRLAA